MEEDGPAFISFNGLPDEDVYEFVQSVDSLRKHFKWSSQITFCYARTMLKGAARKIIQGGGNSNTGGGKAGDSAKNGKSLADEALDPNSWGNLKSALVFEFSDQYQQDRLLVQLLSIKQQTGESGSEYAQRFVGLVSDLVASHPLDSGVLATLFANGLRSEKMRWELLMRRFNSVDRAVGYVAPDQLYRAAKLVPLLSPISVGPPPVSDAAGDLSPTSDSPSAFAAPISGSTSAFIDEADALSTQEVYGHPTAAPPLARGSTANGASFSLDDDEQEEQLAEASGYWTPPRLPDAQQRRHHRQAAESPSHTRPRQATAPAVHQGVGLEPLDMRSLGRTQSMASMRSVSDSVSGDLDDRKSSELTSLAEQLENLSFVLREKSDERRRRPRLCYRCRQKGHVASDCSLPPDAVTPKHQQQSRENLGLQSPASAGPAAHPAEGTGGGRTGERQQHQGRRQSRAPLARSNTVSSASSSLPWRASSVAVYNSIVESSRVSSQPNSPLGNRRYTQSWGWNSGQQHQRHLSSGGPKHQ
ncbi:hypothetical protein GGI15_004596 [Coemansia interrupta]|uniref:CCHC-type domain-containing protein n=1 Tax=Coemansia interrupta TaxID=1126814 RepID=A0A9W8H884_9FUNG|nr:hypothetical protein GGI15_004596 [Coemansia interrupta]